MNVIRREGNTELREKGNREIVGEREGIEEELERGGEIGRGRWIKGDTEKEKERE